MLSQYEDTYQVAVTFNQKICSPGEIRNIVHLTVFNYSTKFLMTITKKNALILFIIIAEVKRFLFCELAHAIFCGFAECLN